MVLVQLITIVETIIFTGFLFVQINRAAVKKAVLLTGLVFVLSVLSLSYFYDNVKSIDSVQIGIETIIILLFSFYYLYERMNDTTTLYIYSAFHFWIVIGMVLYLSGSFFIYIFASSLPTAEVEKYWFITNILSIMKNIFFSIGIIVNSQKGKSNPPSDYILSSLN